MKVVGVGNALVDVLAHIQSDKLLDSLALPKGSMQLINEEKLKIVSAEINKLNPSIVSGGSASNTIVGLACLGIDTGFIGRIGNDFYGDFYKRDFDKYKVRSHLTTVNEDSGVASTFISPDAQRTFGTYLGAAALLNANELKKEDFEGYDYCYIEGYLLQNHQLIARTMQYAKEAGAKIILDLASYNVVESNRDFLTNKIPGTVDIIFANQEEARAMTASDMNPEQAVAYLAKMAHTAIVKIGAGGSWIQQGTTQIHVPAHTVNCLDSTGAGDLYAAGFIYGLIQGASLTACAQVGTLLAGQVIQVIGPKIKDEAWKDIAKAVKNLILEDKLNSF